MHLAGYGGQAADSAEAFEGIDTNLHPDHPLVVIVILLLTYRSPILWLLPIISAVVAYMTSAGVVYLLAKYADLTVNGQSQAILGILVIGAGTDYALLLVARYREELRRHEDRHEAMAFALHRAAPAILASSATVVVSMLCLSFAELNSTAGMGPVLAVGIAVTFLVMVTLLPALLVICGRWVFWPKRPTFGSPEPTSTGFWARVGNRIAPNPRKVWLITAGLLAIACLGLFRLDPSGLSTEDTYTKEFDSIKGQQVLTEHGLADSSNTIQVVANTDALPEVQDALAGIDGLGEPRRRVADERGAQHRGDPGSRAERVLQRGEEGRGLCGRAPAKRGDDLGDGGGELGRHRVQQEEDVTAEVLVAGDGELQRPVDVEEVLDAGLRHGQQVGELARRPQPPEHVVDLGRREVERGERVPVEAVAPLVRHGGPDHVRDRRLVRRVELRAQEQRGGAVAETIPLVVGNPPVDQVPAREPVHDQRAEGPVGHLCERLGGEREVLGAGGRDLLLQGREVWPGAAGRTPARGPAGRARGRAAPPCRCSGRARRDGPRSAGRAPAARWRRRPARGPRAWCGPGPAARRGSGRSGWDRRPHRRRGGAEVGVDDELGRSVLVLEQLGTHNGAVGVGVAWS